MAHDDDDEFDFTEAVGGDGAVDYGVALDDDDVGEEPPKASLAFGGSKRVPFGEGKPEGPDSAGDDLDVILKQMSSRRSNEFGVPFIQILVFLFVMILGAGVTALTFFPAELKLFLPEEYQDDFAKWFQSGRDDLAITSPKVIAARELPTSEDIEPPPLETEAGPTPLPTSNPIRRSLLTTRSNDNSEAEENPHLSVLKEEPLYPAETPTVIQPPTRAQPQEPQTATIIPRAVNTPKAVPATVVPPTQPALSTATRPPPTQAPTLVPTQAPLKATRGRTKRFAVQVVATRSRPDADRVLAALADHKMAARVEEAAVNGVTYYRVIVGNFDEQEAHQTRRALMSKKIVREVPFVRSIE